MGRCLLSAPPVITSPQSVSFTSGTNGSAPSGGMVQIENVLYGTTHNGGTHGNGAIFQYDPMGNSLTPVYSLDDGTSQDGNGPLGNVVTSGNFLYGVTQNGGANGFGVIFQYDTVVMQYTKLYDFDGPHGATPLAGLTLSGNLLYGTTSAGGGSGDGVVFQYDTSANANPYSVLFSFTGDGGAFGGSSPRLN